VIGKLGRHVRTAPPEHRRDSAKRNGCEGPSGPSRHPSVRRIVASNKASGRQATGPAKVTALSGENKAVGGVECCKGVTAIIGGGNLSPLERAGRISGAIQHQLRFCLAKRIVANGVRVNRCVVGYRRGLLSLHDPATRWRSHPPRPRSRLSMKDSASSARNPSQSLGHPWGWTTKGLCERLVQPIRKTSKSVPFKFASLTPLSQAWTDRFATARSGS
jgi:hypothetical protein